jgi:hypothetical protein
MADYLAQLKDDWHAADSIGDTEERARIGRELAARFNDNSACARRAEVDQIDPQKEIISDV